MKSYDEYRSPVGKENGRHASPLVPRTGGLAAAVLDLQRSAGNRATTAIVQRVLTRQDPGMIQDRNLANTILHASANATTPVVVNDIELPQQGLGAAAAAALNTPQFNIVHQAQGGYTATVTQEPNNTLGANVKYPTDPPWRYHQADADRVERALGGRSDANKAKKRSQPWGVMTRRQGAFLFRARGEEGDGTFHRQIRDHELHHVADHWTAALNVLGPWDQALRIFQRAGRTFQGATPQAAEAAVYAAAGLTPQQAGTNLDTEVTTLSNNFHQTPAGRTSDIRHYRIGNNADRVDGWFGY